MENSLDENVVKNFIFLKDNKEEDVNELDEKYLDQLIKYTNDKNKETENDVLFKNSIELLYTTHLDFVIKNEKDFKNNVFVKDKSILTDYLRYRKAFTDAEQYIEALLYHENESFNLSELTDSNNNVNYNEELNIFDLYNDNPKDNLRNLNKSSNSLQRSLINLNFKDNQLKRGVSEMVDNLKRNYKEFDKEEKRVSIKTLKNVINYLQIPKNSIFAKIEPERFAESLHKLSTYLFFLFSTRELEYVGRVENRTYTNKYNKLYSNIFPNLFPLLESEIEIYCESKNLKLLYQKLSRCLETFIKLNNLPMVKTFITILSEFKMCDENFSVINFEQTLKDLTKNNNIYFGFAPEYSLKGKFVGIFSKDSSKEQKIKDLSSIINSITTTKIRLMNTISRKTTFEDILTFEYVKVQTKIDNKLIKHAHRSGRILCLVETCTK